MRTNRLGLMSVAALLISGAVLAGCSSDDDSNEGGGSETGGQAGEGSGGSDNTGGTENTGGSDTETGGQGGDDNTGGTETGGQGGEATGGSENTGGTDTGGSSATGGASTGGSENTGGTGGTGTGGTGEEPAQPITQVTDVNIFEVNGGTPDDASDDVRITDMKGVVFSAAASTVGKIYTAGTAVLVAEATAAVAPNVPDQYTAIVRFNTDGSLDTTFDEDGVLLLNVRPRTTTTTPGAEEGAPPVVTVANSGVEGAVGVVELLNGDVVVAVQAAAAVNTGIAPNNVGTDALLVRVDPDTGNLVPSFGTAGVEKIDFGWSETDRATAGDQPGDLALDWSAGYEKLVLFGHGPARKGAVDGVGAQRTDNDRYVARLNARTAKPDLGFNGGKIVTFGSEGITGPNGDNSRRGEVEADGTIVASGYANFGSGYGNHVVIMRLLPNGTPDASFTYGSSLVGAIVANPFIGDGGRAECYAARAQSNGRYVTVGYGGVTADATTASSFGYAPTQANDVVSFGFFPGELDSDYGVAGTLAIQSEERATLVGKSEQARDLLVLPDDRVVMVGHYGSKPGVAANPNANPPVEKVDADTHPGIMVVTADGFLDDTVGDGGVFRYDAVSVGGNEQFYKVALSHAGTRIATISSGGAQGAKLAILKIGE